MTEAKRASSLSAAILDDPKVPSDKDSGGVAAKEVRSFDTAVPALRFFFFFFF